LRKNAIAYYNKSLEMNPDNANAMAELAKLGVA
jgi:Tfp pilus assembly protein PilF